VKVLPEGGLHAGGKRVRELLCKTATPEGVIVPKQDIDIVSIEDVIREAIILATISDAFQTIVNAGLLTREAQALVDVIGDLPSSKWLIANPPGRLSIHRKL